MIYYVYRHRRLDTGKIFYIGLGSSKNYERAYSKIRTNWWKKVVNKYGYSVEILAYNLFKEEACELEIFLISLYGRRNLGTGCLVNMTDGGDGTPGRKDSKEVLDKRRGKNHYQYGVSRTPETKKILSDKNLRGKHPRARIVLDTQTGIFFDCAKDAAEAYGIRPKALSNYLSGYRKNKTNLIYC